jgi:gliding motility-associated-like protein
VLTAQVFPGSADYTDTTEYTIGGVADSIFVFNADNQNRYVVAKPPGGGTVGFEWEYYNSQNDSYEFLKSETGDSSVIDAITTSMGYRVTIGGFYTARFWVLVNDFDVTITSTDEDRNIREADIFCGRISQIKAEIDSSVMYYYHPTNHNQIRYHSVYQVDLNDWYPNPDPDFTMNVFQKTDNYNLQVAVLKPYWEDTWYVIRVEDRFGLVRKDSAFHESGQPHAFFPEPEYIPLSDSRYYPAEYEEYYGDDYDAISAPAMYLFSNESENAALVEWHFGDTAILKSQADTILHTYMLPGTYYPKIYVTTSLSFNRICIDSFPAEDDLVEPIVIEVDPPTIDAENWPNVFTPPNGEIKYFRFTGDVSITHFEISIYNRYGKRVYQYQGNIRDWEGWDGTYRNSDKIVSTGVYYYVIKELSELPQYDPDPDLPVEGIPSEVRSDIIKGFLHVYNTE